MSHSTDARTASTTTTTFRLPLLLLALFAAAVALAAGSGSDNDNSLLVEHTEHQSSSGQSIGGFYHAVSAFGGQLQRNGTDNRKPAFRDCANLVASVREEQTAGVFVIRVQAYDPDEADRIEYSFVNALSERPRFRIEPKTGNIYTSYQFDRDEPAREKEVRMGAVHVFEGICVCLRVFCLCTIIIHAFSQCSSCVRVARRRPTLRLPGIHRRCRTMSASCSRGWGGHAFALGRNDCPGIT